MSIIAQLCIMKPISGNPRILRVHDHAQHGQLTSTAPEPTAVAGQPARHRCKYGVKKTKKQDRDLELTSDAYFYPVRPVPPGAVTGMLIPR